MHAAVAVEQHEVRRRARRQGGRQPDRVRGPLVMVLWSKVENQKIDRDLEDVDTMIEWIRLSELIVTNDTGPMHVAAALGKPVVALFFHFHQRRQKLLTRAAQ